jgi:hypothetical protein
MLIAQSVTPFGIPRTGLVNLVPFTEIFSMVHAGLGLRKFAYLCSAPLHFFHTDNGAFVGGCVGADFPPEISDVGDTPRPRAFAASRVVGDEQIDGAVFCAMVHIAAIR